MEGQLKAIKLITEQEADTLYNIATRLELDKDELKEIKGKKNRLQKYLIKYLTSDEVEELEDEGISIYHDIIWTIESTFKLRQALKYSLPDTEMKLFGQSSHSSSSNKDDSFPPPTSTNQDSVPLKSLAKLKEFKINGKIGEPGEKDRLTFTSLIFQITAGLKKGYSELEVCDAVIRAMSSDLPIKTYL